MDESKASVIKYRCLRQKVPVGIANTQNRYHRYVALVRWYRLVVLEMYKYNISHLTRTTYLFMRCDRLPSELCVELHPLTDGARTTCCQWTFATNQVRRASCALSTLLRIAFCRHGAPRRSFVVRVCRVYDQDRLDQRGRMQPRSAVCAAFTMSPAAPVQTSALTR